MIDKDKTRFWSKVAILSNNECWNWLAGETRGGYGKFYLNGKTLVSSRVAFEISNNITVPKGAFVMHTCNNRRCVNPAHLISGTHQQNMSYMVACGRCSNGNQIGNRNSAKLTPAQEIEIKAKSLKGLSQRKLGLEYNVCKSAIYYLLRRTN